MLEQCTESQLWQSVLVSRLDVLLSFSCLSFSCWSGGVDDRRGGRVLLTYVTILTVIHEYLNISTFSISAVFIWDNISITRDWTQIRSPTVITVSDKPSLRSSSRSTRQFSCSIQSRDLRKYSNTLHRHLRSWASYQRPAIWYQQLGCWSTAYQNWICDREYGIPVWCINCVLRLVLLSAAFLNYKSRGEPGVTVDDDEESSMYWQPADTLEKLYAQFESKRFRSLLPSQVDIDERDVIGSG